MTEGRQWTLLGINEPGKPGRIVIWDTAEISIGRSPENDIMIDDTDASRKHAEFRRTTDGFQIVDLGTSNGTSVNGQPVREHTLSNKDVVQICEMKLRFIVTRKDPAALGLEVSFASELKGFHKGPSSTSDPTATTLGLVEQVSGPFVVGAVSDFGHAEAQAPKDLDLDLDLENAEFGPGAPGESRTSGSLSLTLEIDGLTPDLRSMLEALLDKTIELPAMRVKIKPDDGL